MVAIRFLQRFLRSAGFYTAKLDGVYGKKTDAAVNSFEERTEEIAVAFGKFDARSEKNIGSLHPKAQQVARVFLKKVRDAGIDARIISPVREPMQSRMRYITKAVLAIRVCCSTMQKAERVITILALPGILGYLMMVPIWGSLRCMKEQSSGSGSKH